MLLQEVLDTLGYRQSPYYRETTATHKPELAPLFRTAREVGVHGMYVFQSSTAESSLLSERPAVYVAEAKTPEEARTIHRLLWNTGQVPFLIVVLPNSIRVYTGFDYSQQNKNAGIVEPEIALAKDSILTKLADFCAIAIDTGEIWRKRSKHLKPQKRVDRRLLDNLKNLGSYLREQKKLPPRLAHALIGKYIYIRYLRDRKILTDDWLKQNNIDISTAFGEHATVNGLRQLCTMLDGRFNGNIFPIDFENEKLLLDEHVALVAAIFKGDQLSIHGERQLSFEHFQVYDFAYIPIELLSSIYEQFLHIEGKGRNIGAYYTPAYLADYLIEEMNATKPLREGMKVLDPSCGSGIFLVMIYAHLIEMRLAQRGSDSKTLVLEELLMLLENIYGVERELDACYVAEFSLILTLLHYADIAEFFHDEQKKLPSLHNTHIFQCDFFDDASLFWQKRLTFDWIIGNPPWIAADDKKEIFAQQWIDTHQKQYPVDHKSVAEAFSWRVLALLAASGYAGLILPATTLLFNLDAKSYRKAFFDQCEVHRITNFSNLRGQLFKGKATAPAITMIYQQATPEQEKPLIEHYGPFSINQITKSDGNKLWAITINENEYQTVSPYEATQGETSTWKYALWGTHRDKRTIARLQRLFPKTLGKLCQENNWHLHEGSQLRDGSISQDGLEFRPELVGKRRFETERQNISNLIFSIAPDALEQIPEEECYIRLQGGHKGLLVSNPPHLIMNDAWKYVIYSDKYFVIKPRQIGLSAKPEDSKYLRALSIFLVSDLVRYYLFFQAPRWGIERDVIILDSVKTIPVPAMTTEQIERLAVVQQELKGMEIEEGSYKAQKYVNEQVIRIFNVPDTVAVLVKEFMQIRLKLINERAEIALQSPNEADLQHYAQRLTHTLDGFITSGKLHHRVIIEHSHDLIGCTIEFVQSADTFTPIIRDVTAQNGQAFITLKRSLEQEFSQWVYVQRGLTIVEPERILFYKRPQLINWTQTQAMNDASDIIAEKLSRVGQFQ